jgi:hypothetical protein
MLDFPTPQTVALSAVRAARGRSLPSRSDPLGKGILLKKGQTVQNRTLSRFAFSTNSLYLLSMLREMHVLKSILLQAICFLLLATFVFARGEKPAENQYVKFSASIRDKHLRPGTTTGLVVRLKPVRGIHINGRPPVEIKIDSSSTISSVGKIDVPRDSSTGFIDPHRPVTVPITLSKNLKPGLMTVKGTLTYYYCSDAEGWCSRFKQPVEFTITIVK